MLCLYCVCVQFSVFKDLPSTVEIFISGSQTTRGHTWAMG